MKRAFVALCLTFGLLTVLAVTLSPASLAGGGCDSVYTVQWGDTLSAIAWRTGVSVQDLACLNNISDVNRIYAGQVLCLAPAAPQLAPSSAPQPASPSSPAGAAVVPPSSSFDLVIEYTLAITGDDVARDWTIGRDGGIGKRLRYPLKSGDAIETFTETVDVRAASEKGMPILWIARNSATEPYTYTLVVIGNPQPLFDLQVGFTRTLTDIFGKLPTAEEIAALEAMGDPPPVTQRPVSALAGNAAKSVKLRAELVSTGPLFVPVVIEAVDYQMNVKTASLRYEFPAFALHPAVEQQNYRLLMVLKDNKAGPPGIGWRRRCDSWRGGGWWFSFLSAWYGCR
jgi:LysM repeat protein